MLDSEEELFEEFNNAIESAVNYYTDKSSPEETIQLTGLLISKASREGSRALMEYKSNNEIRRDVYSAVYNMTMFGGTLDEKVKKCEETFFKKQTDYGPLNISEFGEAGLVLRLNDKLKRLINLYTNANEPQNESLEDTFMDIANYLVILYLIMRDLWTTEVQHYSLVKSKI